MADGSSLTFTRPARVSGALELTDGSRAGLRLPLREGLTFVGRAIGRCEYDERTALAGVVEAAQVFVRVEGGRVWVTDATSTNQSVIERRADAGTVDGEKTGEVETLPHEPFATPLSSRRWVELQPGDVLRHAYGRWRVILL